jgi:hypothetical protein
MRIVQLLLHLDVSGAEAKRVAEPQFSFDTMRRRYIRLYLSLAGTR